MIKIRYAYDINNDAWVIKIVIPCNNLFPDNHRRILFVIESMKNFLTGLISGSSVEIVDHATP